MWRLVRKRKMEDFIDKLVHLLACLSHMQSFGWIPLRCCFLLSPPELCCDREQPDGGPERTKGLCHLEEQWEGRRRGAPQILLLKGLQALQATGSLHWPWCSPTWSLCFLTLRSSALRCPSPSSLSRLSKANCTTSWMGGTHWFSRTGSPTLGRPTPSKVQEPELNYCERFNKMIFSLNLLLSNISRKCEGAGDPPTCFRRRLPPHAGSSVRGHGPEAPPEERREAPGSRAGQAGEDHQGGHPGFSQGSEGSLVGLHLWVYCLVLNSPDSLSGLKESENQRAVAGLEAWANSPVASPSASTACSQNGTNNWSRVRDLVKVFTLCTQVWILVWPKYYWKPRLDSINWSTGSEMYFSKKI